MTNNLSNKNNKSTKNQIDQQNLKTKLYNKKFYSD